MSAAPIEPVDLSSFEMPRERTLTERRHTNRSMFVLTIAIAVCLVAAAALIGYIVGSPDPWDPLGEYPVQTIESTVPGVVGPAVEVGGDVVVSGIKCAKLTTKVRGTLAWSTVEPPGTVLPQSVGVVERAEGCTAFTYHNKMPADVVARVTELASQGVPVSVWRISGSDVPVDADGTEGTERLWTTANFKIVTGAS